MEEMVEPDRTIMIVSIIGLVVIWGSFFYRKFVQGGTDARLVEAPEGEDVAQAPDPATGGQRNSKKKIK